jgi:YD repeat-containing protein
LEPRDFGCPLSASKAVLPRIDGLVGSASRSQSWTFDTVGNFATQVTGGTTQTRSANKQNEITSISSATTPTYDSAGDMTGDETGKQFVYDAWGRLVTVKDSGGSTLATYRYDGLNRRVRETVSGTTTDFYYSSAWQVLEEDVGGIAKNSYVWSPVYIDALIARDRDADGNSGNGLEERLYAMQDANFNVVGVVNPSGTVQERYLYDPYGSVTYLTGSWGSRSSSSYGWVVNFQGLRVDAVANGINDRNREEVPTLGREGRIDPIGFGAGDVDLYTTVSNSPLILLDPLGLQGLGQILGPSYYPQPNRPPYDPLRPGRYDTLGPQPGYGPGYFGGLPGGYLPPQPLLPPKTEKSPQPEKSPMPHEFTSPCELRSRKFIANHDSIRWGRRRIVVLIGPHLAYPEGQYMLDGDGSWFTPGELKPRPKVPPPLAPGEEGEARPNRPPRDDDVRRK